MSKSYFICTTPRSGSTLLCRLLEATGRTGNPDSFYHRAEFMREWAEAWGLPDAGAVSQSAFDIAYLAGAIKAGKAGTEVFGLRLQFEYLKLLSDTLGRIFPGLPSDADRFQRAFGEILYVHLTRADKVAQAVSLVKAQQSGLWHMNADGTEYERLGAPRDPQYDFSVLHREVEALERDDRAWCAWFDRHEIRPLRIGYEAFAAQPSQTVIEICGALGLEPSEAGHVSPRLAKLSDAVSEQWILRYRADLASSRQGIERV
ncbi:Stf0 family sulfotransferase [Dongia sedimenti]|uniref:Stf0 family sulfotransferase n=1 Tax=Dongia sedimenti TaxID=3064282 RepID=A0ABU0YIB8_9PROT|nr:Stf0 family sulfotransferase [Rhodospirillaceae bacterium R-7]